MNGKIVLFIDAAINLVLGVLLLIFSPGIVSFLGVPSSGHRFYPTILGAVLSGIGIALLVECFRKDKGLIGLGLGGAVSINLCGGFVLAIWLCTGRLAVPLHGKVFLWCLVGVLIVISMVELVVHYKKNNRELR